MTYSLDSREFQSRLQRLEVLLQEAERWTDTAAQAHLREIVQAVLDMHAAGLERMLDRLDPSVREVCAGDEVVAGMLLLHGLHPLDLEARVQQALADVRPALRGHSGDVELLEVCDGVVRLRLEGNCHGCPSSSATMRQMVEEAIIGKAPEVLAIEVEGMVEEGAPANERSLLTLPMV